MREQRIDINCDMGEWEILHQGVLDSSFMPYIDTCNISCGAHAGNLTSMQQTLQWAVNNELNIGAHPSYPDRTNFGRKSLIMTDSEFYDEMIGQLYLFKKELEKINYPIHHIKPHGALYHDLSKDIDRLLLFRQCMEELYWGGLPLMLLASSPAVVYSTSNDIPHIKEGFLDRAYSMDLSLVSRMSANAVFTEKESIMARYLDLSQYGGIRDVNNTFHKVEIDSLCIHSDSPNALDNIRSLSKYLQES